MKLTMLLCAAAAAFVVGCTSKKVVVYDERPRTVVVHEPAGTPVRVYERSQPVHVYERGTRYYYYSPAPSHPQKLGEYHVR